MPSTSPRRTEKFTSRKAPKVFARSAWSLELGAGSAAVAAKKIFRLFGNHVTQGGVTLIPQGILLTGIFHSNYRFIIHLGAKGGSCSLRASQQRKISTTRESRSMR